MSASTRFSFASPQAKAYFKTLPKSERRTLKQAGGVYSIPPTVVSEPPLPASNGNGIIPTVDASGIGGSGVSDLATNAALVGAPVAESETALPFGLDKKKLLIVGAVVVVIVAAVILRKVRK